MVEWYHSVYDRARKIEGASQRVQEDTIKFTRIMESLRYKFYRVSYGVNTIYPNTIRFISGYTNFLFW